MQYPLGRKIIHMIPLHYLSLNEEKYVAHTLSPLLPANTLPLRISGSSLQDPTVPFLDNLEWETTFDHIVMGFKVPSFLHHLWKTHIMEVP